MAVGTRPSCVGEEEVDEQQSNDDRCHGGDCVLGMEGFPFID